jgi:hypothetical protein
MQADPARLRNLAVRVQRASGPDRELDTEVFAALNPLWRWDDALGGFVADGVDWIKSPAIYTASLDAAASLVPPGWAGTAEVGPERDFQAIAWMRQLPAGSGFAIQAPTPALALLAAALLAMAHDAEARA